jgi:hypothetical protein
MDGTDPMPASVLAETRAPKARDHAVVAAAPAPELTLVGHSNVIYWWPAWAAGYLVALTTYLEGQTVEIFPGSMSTIHPSNNPGLLFIAVIGLLAIFTNTKLRGIYSVTTGVVLAFVALLFAYLGWVPTLSAKANLGFYLVFSTMMMVIWLLGSFVFDRLTYWRVRPGQVVEERLVVKRLRTVDQDRRRRVDHPLGCGDAAPRLEARSEA